jgi:uncharacterized protein (DUF1697 family)
MPASAGHRTVLRRLRGVFSRSLRAAPIDCAVMARKSYRTSIIRDGSMCCIPVTFDPRAVFGKVRAPVKVTLNGYSFRSTIASMGGTVAIPFRKSHREAAGLEGTETLTVELELDEATRDVEPPPDLVKALKAAPPAWDRWQELSFTHRREYVEAVLGAKREETRARRIASAVCAIAARSPKKGEGSTSKARAKSASTPAPKKTSSKGDFYVALLRGINVGGNNLLPMSDLAAMFAKAGCRDVKTYIQSGNVVFRAQPERAANVGNQIAKAIAARTGMRIPVIVRKAADLRKMVARNPFLSRGADPDELHAMFLGEKPASEKVAALDPKRSPPDQFAVSGSEIYLHCPNGYGRSKLTNAYFDSKLGTVSTVRNWRTVLKLLDLAGG